MVLSEYWVLCLVLVLEDLEDLRLLPLPSSSNSIIYLDEETSQPALMNIVYGIVK